MKYAEINGVRVTAEPGLHGTCPCCGADVISKCGSILVWHWAHIAADCDAWSEPESEWHYRWKSLFPVSWQEVKVGPHRADVKTPRGFIEFQSSGISPAEIAERENFYGRLVWVLNGAEFKNNLHLRQRDGFVSFRWRWPRKSWWYAARPIVIDTEYGLLHVKKLHNNVPCGGWGNLITFEQFVGLVGA